MGGGAVAHGRQGRRKERTMQLEEEKREENEEMKAE